MKNIHILPTHKPSKLVKRNLGLIRVADNFTKSDLDFILAEFVNIYITSDEEIKDVRPYKGKCQLETGQILNKFPNYLTDLSECKLVIMTTDQNLIKDGVQAIDDAFLEWFVKNPSCERVEISKIEDELISPKNPKIRFSALQDPASFISAESLNNMILTYKYKIIISKEEVLLQSSIDGEPIWGEAKKDINTCKNFDRETGCDLVDCPCEKEEILEKAKQMMVTQEDILEQIALTEARGEKIVKYLNRYKGDSIYNEIALAIEFGYQLKLEEDEK